MTSAEAKRVTRVALTMHDLPQWPHWTSSYASSPEKIFDQILAALAKHSIKGVYNFTNSGTGLTPGSDTSLAYQPHFKSMLDRWCLAGQHIGNHTHSHVAIHAATCTEVKADIVKADKALSPWIKKAPSKFFCFCTDCQGETDEESKDFAAFLENLGYIQVPAASMVWEWRWEAAYLLTLAEGDHKASAQIRRDFVKFSVRQTLFDAKRGRQRWGSDFAPTLLLHMLTIVADTLDEWLSAHKAAGCKFVPVEDVIKNELYTSWDWPESESEQARMMKDIRARMKEAFDKKIVVPTKHLEVVPVKAKEETKQDVESKRKRERPEGTQDDAGEAVPPKEKQQRKTSPQTL